MYRIKFNELDLRNTKFLDHSEVSSYYCELVNWLKSNCKETYSLKYKADSLDEIYFDSMSDLILFKMTW